MEFITFTEFSPWKKSYIKQIFFRLQYLIFAARVGMHIHLSSYVKNINIWARTCFVNSY
jgi:hypothetical protein